MVSSEMVSSGLRHCVEHLLLVTRAICAIGGLCSSNWCTRASRRTKACWIASNPSASPSICSLSSMIRLVNQLMSSSLRLRVWEHGCMVAAMHKTIYGCMRSGCIVGIRMAGVHKYENVHVGADMVKLGPCELSRLFSSSKSQDRSLSRTTVV